MPRSVIEAVGAHHVVRASALGALLDGVTREEVSAESVPPPSHLMVVETDMAQMEEHVMDVADRPGEPAGFSCPDCGGTLFEVREGTMTRYRCRVGHAWTTKGLIGEQAVQVDNALWIALRALEEKAALADQLADRAVESGSVLTAGRFREQAEDSREAARQVRRLIEARPAPEMELVDE
jgi:two-component system chemotaxis response regulator CheB